MEHFISVRKANNPPLYRTIDWIACPFCVQIMSVYADDVDEGLFWGDFQTNDTRNSSEERKEGIKKI